MKSLEVEISGDETGELSIVVTLVDMEELVFFTRNNGKAVFANGIIESLVEGFQLERVDDVLHVNHHPGRNHVILGLQKILAFFQLLDESLFGGSVLDRSCLSVFLFPKAVLHFLSVP